MDVETYNVETLQCSKSADLSFSGQKYHSLTIPSFSFFSNICEIQLSKKGIFKADFCYGNVKVLLLLVNFL